MVREPWRPLLMLLALLGLGVGVLAGLARMGGFPFTKPHWPAFHGPLMVGGFLGTLIGLERAVALRSRLSFIPPVLSAAATLVFIFGGPPKAGILLLVLASVGFVLVTFALFRRQPAVFTAVMGAGSTAWFVGNLLWAFGRSFVDVVPWWQGFLVLTIVAERLELSQSLRARNAGKGTFLLSVALYLAGLLLSPLHPAGIRMAGAGSLAVALWLLRYDIARHTVRVPGLPRFVALCLLVGYGWLGVAGVGMLAGPFSGLWYDAVLHAIFLGFVFSMIFAHAPTIFPAVMGLGVGFSPVFYLHFLLLHLSLLVRVLGDLTGEMALRRLGGIGNGLAIALFFGSTLIAILQTRFRKG